MKLSILLSLQLGGQVTEFGFEWEQLCRNQRACYVWEYKSATKPAEDQPVIYRHVVQVPDVGIVTVYVGEGSSFDGPSERHICFQYRGGGHGETRVRILSRLRDRATKRPNEHGWTEILRVSNPRIDLSDARKRKFLEATLITAYYWQHCALADRGLDIPDFLNDPR